MKRDNDYEMIAQECGAATAKRLSAKMGGLTLYIPTRKNTSSIKKRAFILKNFNGANQKELAKKTGYSVRWVYYILRSTRRPVANL